MLRALSRAVYLSLAFMLATAALMPATDVHAADARQATPYDRCEAARVSAERFPTVSDLPILGATPADVPPAHLASLPEPINLPIEGYASAAVVVAALLLRNYMRRFRIVFTLTAAAAGGITILLAVASTSLMAADYFERRHEHLRAIHFLSRIEVPFEYVRWVGRWNTSEPIDIRMDGNLIDGVHEALEHADVEALTMLVDTVPGVSEPARHARHVAYLALAADRLAQGQLADAEQLGVVALSVEVTPAAHDAVSTAIAHQTMHAIAAADAAAATAHVDRLINRGWRPALTAQLAGAVTRLKIEQLAGHDGLPEALRLVEQVWTVAGHIGTQPPFIACQFAALLEVEAANRFDADDATAAVATLRRAETLVSDSPFARTFFPDALLKEGLAQMAAGDGVSATTTLVEALRRSPAPRADIVDAVEEAYLVRAAGEAAEAQWTSAFLSVTLAESHAGPSERADELRARLHLARGDYNLRRGAWAAARGDLEVAGRYDVLAEESARRLRHIEATGNLLARLRVAGRWAAMPAISGAAALAASGDRDGREYFVFFNGDDAVAVAPADDISAVSLVSPSDGATVVGLVEDTNGDRQFDRVTHLDGRGGTSILDIDGDNREDLKLTLLDGEVVDEEPLSAKIEFFPSRAAVSAVMDYWFAGAADVYAVVTMNGETVLRADAVAMNTQFPRFNRAVTLDYKARDEVRLFLFDRDPVGDDDFIDVMTVRQLPTTRTLVGENRHAAVEVRVTPSQLADRQIALREMDLPALDIPDVPEASELIATARQVEASGNVGAMIAKVGASELLVAVMFPRLSLLGHFMASTVAYEAVSVAVK